MVFLNMFAGAGDPSWLQNIPGKPFLGLLLTITLLLGIVYLATNYLKPLFATLLLLIGLGAVAHIMGSPEPYYLRFFIAVPAVFTIITVGVAALVTRLQLPSKGIELALVAIIAMRMVTVSDDYAWWAKQPQVVETANTYERMHWQQAEEVAKLLEKGEVYIQTGSRRLTSDRNDLPVVSVYVLYRIGAWDSESAKRKGLHFIDANSPASVNSIPSGATVYYM
jgi:hypothetical protein